MQYIVSKVPSKVLNVRLSYLFSNTTDSINTTCTATVNKTSITIAINNSTNITYYSSY